MTVRRTAAFHEPPPCSDVVNGGGAAPAGGHRHARGARRWRKRKGRCSPTQHAEADKEQATTSKDCGTCSCVGCHPARAASNETVPAASSAFPSPPCPAPDEPQSKDCSDLRMNPICESRVLWQFLVLAGKPCLDWKSLDLCSSAIRVLCACHYDIPEVCSVLAHASMYFSEVHAQCRDRMGFSEAGNIIVLAVYLAHVHVLDETFALSDWHRHLCRDYCDMKTLNKAVMRVMRMRGYILRVPDVELQQRYSELFCAAVGHRP